MTWLRDKCLVVIGGTSGIGLAAIHSFLDEGARVVAVGLASAEARPQTDQCLFLEADARDERTAPLAIEKCEQTFGGFHGLYHVAGGSGRKFGDGPLHEMSVVGWDQTLALNLSSLMLSNRAALAYWMDRKQRGTLLNMASVLAYSPSPRYFVTHAYAVAKAAIIGLTQSAAAYYAPHNIRINALAPSLVETPMAQRAANDEAIQKFLKTKQPLEGGRMGRPDDLSAAATYFMSDYSRFTTGQVLTIDGGWALSEGQY